MTSNMQHIASLLLASYNKGADEVIKVFHENATIEFPYSASLGRATRLSVHEFHEYLKMALPKLKDLRFGKLKLYKIEDADAYWAETHAEATITSTGHFYKQDYVTYIEIRDDKIFYYKEYWNILPILQELMTREELKRILECTAPAI